MPLRQWQVVQEGVAGHVWRLKGTRGQRGLKGARNRRGCPLSRACHCATVTNGKQPVRRREATLTLKPSDLPSSQSAAKIPGAGDRLSLIGILGIIRQVSPTAQTGDEASTRRAM